MKTCCGMPAAPGAHLRTRLFIGLLAIGQLGFIAPKDADVLGLWSKYARSNDPAAPLRFYYFHPGGVGLYRYGRVGMNYTNGFDYTVRADRIELRFRKTGQKHSVRFSIEKTGSHRWLILHDDPKDDRRTRYERIAGPMQAEAADHPFARMWTHHEARHGTRSFFMYQFENPRRGGLAGSGWYHEGDYDDWRTEALDYRVVGPAPRIANRVAGRASRSEDGQQARLELRFRLNEERWSTPIRLGESDGHRSLELEADPRNFWHRRVYLDGGRSFALDPSLRF